MIASKTHDVTLRFGPRPYDARSMLHEEHHRVCPSVLVYDAATLARMLGVSVRHIRRLDATGQLPRAIRLGRSKRWPVDVIREWLRAGSPPRKEWESMHRPSRKAVQN